MTEDIGSDKHKRPSSAEIDAAEKMAVMRERLSQAKARDEEILKTLKDIQKEQSEQGKMLALGNVRFKSIEDKQDETTTALTGLNLRVEATEKHQASVVHKIAGAGILVSFILGAWALIKDFLGKGGGS